jgi:Cu+-exporting ATPase
MTKTIFSVEGMSCASCIEHVKRALAIEGVANVDVRIDEAAVAVDHEPWVSTGRLIAALGQAGYEASLRARDPASHV